MTDGSIRDIEGRETGTLCTVIVNYQTPDLLETAVRSFVGFYPNIPVIIVDNGSSDESLELIDRLVEEYSSINSILLNENLGHGPAMDRAVQEHHYDYYFFLDSDTETYGGDFLEIMLTAFSDAKVYGVGQVQQINERGFEEENGFSVLVAAYMLIKGEIYRTLPPFEHHGMPTIHNFLSALQQGYHFVEFPMDDFIHHLHRGTVNRFGYGLGLKGKINFLRNKFGI